MNDDFYLVLTSALSGASYVWANAKTESFATARKSLDGSLFIVKYTNFLDVPVELMFNLVMNEAGIKNYIATNVSEWESDDV